MVQLPLRAPARKEVSTELDLLELLELLELEVIWFEWSDLVSIEFWFLFCFFSWCKFLNQITRSKCWVHIQQTPHPALY